MIASRVSSSLCYNTSPCLLRPSSPMIQRVIHTGPSQRFPLPAWHNARPMSTQSMKTGKRIQLHAGFVCCHPSSSQNGFHLQHLVSIDVSGISIPHSRCNSTSCILYMRIKILFFCQGFPIKIIMQIYLHKRYYVWNIPNRWVPNLHSNQFSISSHPSSPLPPKYITPTSRCIRVPRALPPSPRLRVPIKADCHQWWIHQLFTSFYQQTI